MAVPTEKVAKLLADLEHYVPTVRGAFSSTVAPRSWLVGLGLLSYSCGFWQVPDELTQQHLKSTGYDCKDVRL